MMLNHKTQEMARKTVEMNTPLQSIKNIQPFPEKDHTF